MRRLNAWRWYSRLPAKWGLFGLTVFAVCYPYPSVFVRHVKHWRDPNALIEPNNPDLARQFIAFLRTPEALRSFKKYGFE